MLVFTAAVGIGYFAGGFRFEEQYLGQALIGVDLGHQVGGASIDHAALAWRLMHPVQAVSLLDTGNASRIGRAVEALDVTLSREQWARIWEASTGCGVP
jgi:predicted oxidoreductase